MDDNNHKSVVNSAGKNLDNKQAAGNTWLIIKVNINFYLLISCKSNNLLRWKNKPKHKRDSYDWGKLGRDYETTKITFSIYFYDVQNYVQIERNL